MEFREFSEVYKYLRDIKAECVIGDIFILSIDGKCKRYIVDDIKGKEKFIFFRDVEKEMLRQDKLEELGI